MIDRVPPSHCGCAGQEALTLTVGCEFGLNSLQPATAVVQVAPCLQAGVCISAELWETSAGHHSYVDHYGNRCERFELAAGGSHISYEAQLVIMRPADLIEPDARETPVAALPDDVLSFVMPSRFCLPDELGHEAWQRFGDLTPGWGRVQAIVDYVHGALRFVPGASNPWTTAADAYRAGQGVCRDFAHLAITLCRCLNIPARYATGYLGDIGVPPVPDPMDFSAWFEVYLQGQWYTFDARHNRRRIGRVLIGLGRDAADVPITMSFGQQSLEVFRVITEEIDLAVVPGLSLKHSNMRRQLEVSGARSYNNERLH